jgi:hypothetical protein
VQGVLWFRFSVELAVLAPERPTLKTPSEVPVVLTETVAAWQAMRNRDGVKSMAAFLITALHWFNPLPWLTYFGDSGKTSKEGYYAFQVVPKGKFFVSVGTGYSDIGCKNRRTAQETIHPVRLFRHPSSGTKR